MSVPVESRYDLDELLRERFPIPDTKESTMRQDVRCPRCDARCPVAELDGRSVVLDPEPSIFGKLAVTRIMPKLVVELREDEAPRPDRYRYHDEVCR